MWMIFLWVANTSKTFPVKITALVFLCGSNERCQAGQGRSWNHPYSLKCWGVPVLWGKGCERCLDFYHLKLPICQVCKCHLLPRAGKCSMPRLAGHPPGDSIPCNTPLSQQPAVVISSSRTANPVLTCWSQGNENICVMPTHHTEEPHSTLDLPVQPSSTSQLLMSPSWDKAQQWVSLTHLLFWHCLSSLPYRAQKIYISVSQKHSGKFPSEKFPQ